MSPIYLCLFFSSQANQEALTVFGKLQAVNVDRMANQETSTESNQEIFERENQPLENRHEYLQNVTHVTYGRGQDNNLRSPYNQNTAPCKRSGNYNGKTEGSF